MEHKPIERIRQALAAGPTEGPLVVENDMVYRESDEDLERPLIHVNTTQFTEHEFFGLIAVDALWFATCTPETIRSLLSRLDELEKVAAKYAPKPGELPRYVTQCFGCEGFPSGKNNPCDVCGRAAIDSAIAKEQG